MLKDVLAAGAIIGGGIGIVAYIPQIIHLIKVKDSSGISVASWSIWLFGNTLLLLYAISIINWPYIIVETLFVTNNIIIIILAYRYKK